jgi:hypothetical protein
MTVSTTPHAWMTHVAHRISASSVGRIALLFVPPCVLDLLGHTRPQSHAAMKAVI